MNKICKIKYEIYEYLGVNDKDRLDHVSGEFILENPNEVVPKLKEIVKILGLPDYKKLFVNYAIVNISLWDYLEHEKAKRTKTNKIEHN